jgi:hypothetical protein
VVCVRALEHLFPRSCGYFSRSDLVGRDSLLAKRNEARQWLDKARKPGDMTSYFKHSPSPSLLKHSPAACRYVWCVGEVQSVSCSRDGR